MTDLTTACSALPRGLRPDERHRAEPAAHPDLVRKIARILAWVWLQWRRREIIRALERVDDRLLCDVGIERGEIESFVDALMARAR
ncbi:MAG: DUF1127 domain-containing protein [Dongiaceae bacterium]